MRQSPLLSNLDSWPRPANADRAALGRERWLERAKRETDATLKAFAVDFAESASGQTVLSAVFGNSPYLGDSLLKEMAFFRDLLESDPKDAAEAVQKRLIDEAPAASDDDALRRLLRVTKRQTALTIALADIAGIWAVEEIMDALSDFADASLAVTVDHLLRHAAEEGNLTPPNPEKPSRDSGFIVFAMGKLGAHELNYSSDVDLIVLYDGERTPYCGDQDIQRFFERLTRNLIAILEDRTADGYAFRTDLRLRPDPGAMPIALSVTAAEIYYESTGQNWERAALIKARPVAGDIAAGNALLEILRPFLWRKSLDFAAIEDIHSIKRQIEFHRGGHAVAVAGHNVKLGRGGIREIELFTQTQQLIWGGRMPELRHRKTCDTLRALASAGHVNETVAEELIATYRYLRRIEHRLQMVDDQQTHTLPKDPDELAAFATFLGYNDLAAFETEISEHLGRVVRYSSELFDESPGLGAEEGKLVFTGGEDDPETLETLEKMGFRDAPNVAAVVRGWHHGRYRATRAERVRQILTELMPALLRAFTKTVNPNAAFMKFDDFLSKLPAGVPLFSLFQANPLLLDLVAEIMGSTPRLADNLSRNPIILDSVLTADFFDPPPPQETMAEELAEALRQARDFQDVLDVSRRWANDWKFRIGVQVLRNLLASDDAGKPLSDVAETVVTTMFDYVEKDFRARHGEFPDGGMVVVAMGKLGGYELTFQSDLDLVFVYDVPGGVERSNGERPLSPSHYFARLGQALTSALTSLTGEGKLYDIDTRLRPSGNAGPPATSLAAYREYFREAAWTWEYLALIRARTLAGPPSLCEAVGTAITEALARPIAPDKLVCDVAEMRSRIAAQRPGKHFWDIKDRPGGLIDVEFLCQYLVLANLAKHPEIRNTNVRKALERLRAGKLLAPEESETLTVAAILWHRVLGLLRLSFEGSFEESDIPEGLRMALIRATESEDFKALKTRIAQTAEDVAQIFKKHITEAAEEASDGT